MTWKSAVNVHSSVWLGWLCLGRAAARPVVMEFLTMTQVQQWQQPAGVETQIDAVR